MEAVILCGLQGSGKSTFCRGRFFDTHIRLNYDMLRTRHRESILLRACIEARQPFVSDNTNVTPEERARYITPARAAGFRVVGYYFSSRVDDARRRNARREGRARVPDAGILGMAGRLVRPRREEGFDALHYVRIAEDGAFVVEEWRDEAGST